MTILEGVSLPPDGSGNVCSPDVRSKATSAPSGSTAVVAAAHTLVPQSRSSRPPSAKLGPRSRSSDPDPIDPTTLASGTEAIGAGTDRLRSLLRSGLQGDWRDRARCAESDPELFYPEARETAPIAKLICSLCEVRDECLAAALAGREPHGIWGGLTYRERLAVARAERPAGHQTRRRRRG